MEAKFMKGPYKASKHPGERSGYYIVGPAAELGSPILASIDWVKSDESTAAYAHLFAASWELYDALEEYLQARPAFRLKPVGGPGSAARLQQEAAIAAEDRALAVLRKARGETLPEAA